jgi:hypothetical protein
MPITESRTTICRVSFIALAAAVLAWGCSGQGGGSSTTTPAKSEWDADIATLPKWTPKESALGRLDAEVALGNYSIRPPKGLKLSSGSDKPTPEPRNHGTYQWYGDGLSPALWVILEPRVPWEWDKGAAGLISTALHTPGLVFQCEPQPSAVEFGNVNGLVVARARFQGRGKSPGNKPVTIRGYQMIGRVGDSSLDLLALVSDADGDDTLDALEASLLTLRKR